MSQLVTQHMPQHEGNAARARVRDLQAMRSSCHRSPLLTCTEQGSESHLCRSASCASWCCILFAALPGLLQHPQLQRTSTVRLTHCIVCLAAPCAHTDSQSHGLCTTAWLLWRSRNCSQLNTSLVCCYLQLLSSIPQAALTGYGRQLKCGARAADPCGQGARSAVPVNMRMKFASLMPNSCMLSWKARSWCSGPSMALLAAGRALAATLSRMCAK